MEHKNIQRIIYYFAFLFLILLAPSARADIDTSSLIKVTPENNPKCVEYYNYNGDVYCSTTAKAKPPGPEVKSYEKMDIEFDDRPWRLAWGNQDNTGTTVEYVPNDEDVENWNELITSQFFPGVQDKATLKQFADSFVQNLRDNGYNPIVTFHEDTPNRLIFEFRITNPDNQIQDELQMLTKDDQGIYVLHYVIRKADMGDENRQKWIKNLKDSSIEDDDDHGDRENDKGE